MCSGHVFAPWIGDIGPSHDCGSIYSTKVDVVINVAARALVVGDSVEVPGSTITTVGHADPQLCLAPHVVLVKTSNGDVAWLQPQPPTQAAAAAWVAAIDALRSL